MPNKARHRNRNSKTAASRTLGLHLVRGEKASGCAPIVKASNAPADHAAGHADADSTDNFPPGKILGLPDEKLPAAKYISEINEHWKQVLVEDFQIANLCAHADLFLGPTEKALVARSCCLKLRLLAST